ncbi:hypothetical protein JOM56_000654 [Amanita muscaria]
MTHSCHILAARGCTRCIPFYILFLSTITNCYPQSHFTGSPELFDEPFDAETIKGPLTRNIGAKFADVQDEIAAAFKECYIPIKGDGNFPPANALFC